MFVCTKARSFGQERNKCGQERIPHPSSFKTEMPWIEDQFVKEVILAILPFSQLHYVSGLPFSCIRRRCSSTQIGQAWLRRRLVPGSFLPTLASPPRDLSFLGGMGVVHARDTHTQASTSRGSFRCRIQEKFMTCNFLWDGMSNGPKGQCQPMHKLANWSLCRLIKLTKHTSKFQENPSKGL